MARIRSPNYPAISLPDALTRIAQVHERERQHPAAKDVVIKGMGYGGVNGASLSSLSAAVKYGLLSQEGKGEDYRVSDRAVAILHPHSPDEKANALREAAHAPALFGELLEHFKGSLPSDDNLRAYLVRRGFSQTSLPSVIQSFRDTMELVTPGEPEQNAAPRSPLTKPASSGGATLTPKQTVTATFLAEKGMSESTVQIQDDRIELAAVLYDQEGLQKVIDRLTAVKGLLPPKAPKKEEAAN